MLARRRITTAGARLQSRTDSSLHHLPPPCPSFPQMVRHRLANRPASRRPATRHPACLAPVRHRLATRSPVQPRPGPTVAPTRPGPPPSRLAAVRQRLATRPASPWTATRRRSPVRQPYPFPATPHACPRSHESKTVPPARRRPATSNLGADEPGRGAPAELVCLSV